MVYHFKIHEELGKFWATCIELEGCNTQADTREELKRNMKEVLDLYLEEPIESEILFPLPKATISEKDMEDVEVDLQIAFAILLRHIRTNHNLTQKEVAEKLGMKNIYSYQRLEKKSNPTLMLIKKLKSVFPELSVDYVMQ
jgi:predicted RNase H-like HicB family nuclease/DNA-binding XRE family transcriptional regulator